jgi:hypothetical protein
MFFVFLWLKNVFLVLWLAHALMSRKRRLPVAFAMRTLMSLSAFANGIGSVSVSQTAFALA